jgi:hypothetical protein
LDDLLAVESGGLRQLCEQFVAHLCCGQRINQFPAFAFGAFDGRLELIGGHVRVSAPEPIAQPGNTGFEFPQFPRCFCSRLRTQPQLIAVVGFHFTDHALDALRSQQFVADRCQEYVLGVIASHSNFQRQNPGSKPPRNTFRPN